VTGELAPSSDQSILGDTTRPPSQGGFKFVGEDGNFVKDWSNQLPEDMGDFRTKLARYRNPVELAKALHSANQTLGKKGVIVPTKDSSAEEISAYRKQMGVPDNPKGYLEKAPQMAPGLTFDEGIAQVYMEAAHKWNIPADAMAELMAINAKHAEIQQNADRQRVGQVKYEGQQQLRKVWGRDYERNMGMAARAVHFAGGNVNSYGFRDPEAVRVVVALAKEISEDRIIGPAGALPEGTHEMKASALDIMRNPQNKDFQKYRDGDPDVRARVRRMLEQAEANTNIRR
jgi:hypothetical protein